LKQNGLKNVTVQELIENSNARTKELSFKWKELWK